MNMKSWRTTLLGVMTILGAIANCVKAAIDGDPSTVVDIPLTLSAITAGMGLVAARDNRVTSEQAGAK